MVGVIVTLLVIAAVAYCVLKNYWPPSGIGLKHHVDCGFFFLYGQNRCLKGSR